MLDRPYRPAPQVLRRLREVDFAAVIGPSAVGKTTLIRAALTREPGLSLVLNNTSRAARPDEREGVDYRFQSRDRMLERLAKGEYAQVAPAVFGDLYATAAEDYATDGIALLPVLADALPDFRALPFRSLRTVYVLPPSWAVWQHRLAGHGFGPERRATRLAEARRSLEFARDDATVQFVVNDDLDTAVAEFVAAVTGRERPDGLPGSRDRALDLVHRLLSDLGAAVAPRTRPPWDQRVAADPQRPAVASTPTTG